MSAIVLVVCCDLVSAHTLHSTLPCSVSAIVLSSNKRRLCLNAIESSLIPIGVLNSLQISKYEDPQEAAIAVVVEAYRLWLQYEVRTDDITIIIARVEGLRETSAINKKQSMK